MSGERKMEGERETNKETQERQTERCEKMCMLNCVDVKRVFLGVNWAFGNANGWIWTEGDFQKIVERMSIFFYFFFFCWANVYNSSSGEWDGKLRHKERISR